MAIEYKKSITLTKDSTIYGHQSLDEGGFPADAGNAKVSQVLDLAENQTVDTLKQSITITTDSSNTLLYHFNIGGESVATFTVPSDKFLKSVSYDTATRELVFTFVTSEGENVVRVDMSALVDTYTAGNGLALSGNVFSVRIKGTETRLSVSSDGLSIDLSDIIALIDTERTQRQNTYTDLDARIVVIENKMTEIDAAVTTCTTKAQEASASASLASGHATTASEKATAASNSASLASGYATNANTYKTEAETAKNNAEAYASNASDSADTASAKATAASTSASNASESADTASTKATEASTSASNASASATLASTKATEASASASTASTKASEAAASATKASASEANAKTSETNAKASATTASTKATEASTSASNASASATKASGYATEAISAKNTAKLWAISETIVESTDYSSKYYANKSKEYRDEAETFSKQLCYFRKQSYAVSASAGASAITIPSEAQYRPLADILFVHNKGVFLKEDTDYTKSDTGIVLATALTADTTIEFDVLRAVSTESQSYDLLKGDKGDKGEDGLYSKAQLLDMIYPVGAIYTSLKNVSPAGTLGGTWVSIQNRFLYAEGAEGAGTENGSSTHSHTITVNGHTLTVDEMPNHWHGLYLYDNTSINTNHDTGWNQYGKVPHADWHSSDYYRYAYFHDSGAYDDYFEHVGGSGSHSHTASSASASSLPPYLRVYMWQRTA